MTGSCSVTTPPDESTDSLILTALSNLGPRPRRADARRNTQRILDATAELIATDPRVGLEQVADHAGVSRATLYHHFASRNALLDALTDRSVAEVTSAVQTARPEQGTAIEAIKRVLIAAWKVIGRYRGLVIVNAQRLPRSELRGRLESAIAPIRSLIERGQRNGEFDPDLPADWLINAVIDLIHAASQQVTAGAMPPREAEWALLRSAMATLTSHRQIRSGQ